MKNLTLFPLMVHPIKKAGIVLSIIALVLTVVAAKMEGFAFIETLNPEQHFQLFFCITLLGLYLTAFSKEKTDDERVKMIRSKALQVAFGLLVSVIIAANFTGIFYSEFSRNAGGNLSLFAAFGLLVYLFFFHIGLYFDPDWVYNDDPSLINNLKQNKLFFMIYTLIVVLSGILIYLV